MNPDSFKSYATKSELKSSCERGFSVHCRRNFPLHCNLHKTNNYCGTARALIFCDGTPFSEHGAEYVCRAVRYMELDMYAGQFARYGAGYVCRAVRYMELDMYAGQFARYGAGYVCRAVRKKLTPHKNKKELLLSLKELEDSEKNTPMIPQWTG